MMGIQINQPPITFTETGFPKELIQELERQTSHEIIGNIASSGTTILEQLAPIEIESNSKKIIVYTSADSVLQIYRNEQTMGIQELYRCCKIAREITMRPKWKIERIIARPYIVKNGKYIRTHNRKDYTLAPPKPTCLDILKDNHFDVIGIGKISDIYNNQGITKAIHSKSSLQGMDQTIEMTNEQFHGICFTNLVDFDAKWRHRRNPIGYGKKLEAFDKKFIQRIYL